nr:unnamed protein product [Digitaria exilis]
MAARRRHARSSPGARASLRAAPLWICAVPVLRVALPAGSASRWPAVAARGAPLVSTPLLRALPVHLQNFLGEHADAPPSATRPPRNLCCPSSTQHQRAAAA